MIAQKSQKDEDGYDFNRLIAWISWSRLAVSVALAFSLVGCAAAYNSRHDHAANKRYSVVCHIRGAFGRAYYHETEKKIIISIYSHGPNDEMLEKKDLEEQEKSHPGVWMSHPIPGLETKLLLEREYHIKGSDLCWRSVWSPQNDLSIDFYDYGPNVVINPPMKAPPERILRTVKFSFDSIAGTYKERAGSKP